MRLDTPNPQFLGLEWEQPSDLSTKASQERLSPAAIAGFLQIAKLWKLRDEDARVLLGGISNGAFYALKRRPRKTLDQDQLTRISLLVGIFKALNIVFSRKLADAWIQLPNTNSIFSGAAPLSYMLK